MSKVATTAITVLMLVLLAVSCLGSAWIIEVPVTLALGWIRYLTRVLPNVRWNLSAIGVVVIAAPIAAVLAHRMASWLWTGMGNASLWRWKWTLSGLATLTLMFVVGMAATGVAHQTGWLINSPKPLVESRSRPRMQRLMCSSNLETLQQIIATYRESHPDFRPKTLAEVVDLALSNDLQPSLFVCPASADETAPSDRPSEWRAMVLRENSSNLSYRLALPGTLGPDGKRFVLLYEKSLDNHEDGLNILYENGEVEWIDETPARAWLNSLNKAATTQGQ